MYVDTAVSKGFPGISENHFLNEAVVLGLRHSLPVPDILDRVHIVGQGHLDRGQYRALLNKTGPGSVRAHIRAVGARLLVVDSIAEAVCRETVTGLFDFWLGRGLPYKYSGDYLPEDAPDEGEYPANPGRGEYARHYIREGL